MIGVSTGKDRGSRLDSAAPVIGSGDAAGKKAVKLVFVLVLVIGVLCLLVRSRRSANGKVPPRAPSGPENTDEKDAGPYRSVSINPGEAPCGGARTLAGQRYLLGNAPMLPLAGCDAAQCECRYSHHADRRDHGGDRRLMNGLERELYGAEGEERRVAGDRRGDDPAAELPGSPDREAGAPASEEPVKAVRVAEVQVSDMRVSDVRVPDVPVTEAVVSPAAEAKKTGAVAPVQ